MKNKIIGVLYMLPSIVAALWYIITGIMANDLFAELLAWFFGITALVYMFCKGVDKFLEGKNGK